MWTECLNYASTVSQLFNTHENCEQHHAPWQTQVFVTPQNWKQLSAWIVVLTYLAVQIEEWQIENYFKWSTINYYNISFPGNPNTYQFELQLYEVYISTYMFHKLQDTNKNAIQDHVNHDRESSFNTVAMDDTKVHSG